ncbi:MAG: restriction endonuclease subunit S, partial [Candidatus Paceibacteria bacterium]
MRDELYLGEFNTVELSASEVKKLALEDGDILVVRTNGNPLYVGRSVLVENLGKRFAYASYLIRIRVDKRRITPAYAACVFGSSQMRQALRRLAKSSAGNFNLNSKDIRSIRLPVPSIEEQTELVAQVSSLRRTSKDLNKRVDAALALKRRLLEDISS